MANESPETQSSAQNKRAPKAWQVLLPVVGIALAAIFAGLFLQRGVGPGDSPQGQIHRGLTLGGTIPDFESPLLKGGTVRFSKLGAKVTLVNFWATWCEACMVEMPSIVKLWKDYHSKGFEVLAVDLDENPAAVAPKALARLGMEFPVLTDPEGKMGELFDVHAIPLTVILDRNGKILFMKRGELDWNSSKVREMLDAWLAG